MILSSWFNKKFKHLNKVNEEYCIKPAQKSNLIINISFYSKEKKKEKLKKNTRFFQDKDNGGCLYNKNNQKKLAMFKANTQTATATTTTGIHTK